MKPNKTTELQKNEQDALEPISKTKRKTAMDELQDIGVRLIELSKDRLTKLDLPETLLDAIKEAKRITANGASRRQRQYIGSLMRNVDVSPILEQLEKWDGKNNEENAYFHRLENWRSRLIAEDNALAEFMTAHPNVETQKIRTLIRNAKREQAQNKPPKSSRELFKLLREITSSESSAAEEDDDNFTEDDNAS
jgi:ribosome-associated protein